MAEQFQKWLVTLSGSATRSQPQRVQRRVPGAEGDSIGSVTGYVSLDFA